MAKRFDPSKASAEFMLIDAKTAREWLAEPTIRIRRLIRSRVERHMRVLKRGDWVPGWDAIAWADTGKRINGEHRLTAIAESGRSAWLLVVRGIPEAALDVGDQGAKRTLGQVLALRNEPSPSALAASLRNIWQWRNGFQIGERSQKASPDITEQLELLAAEPGIREAVQLGTKIRRHAPIGSDGLGITLAHLFMEADPDEAEVFFDQLMEGTNLQDGDPILVVREALYRLKANTGSSKGIDITFKAALLIKAFNYWRAGQRIQSIGWRRGGRSPEPFPSIEPASEASGSNIVPRPDPAHRVVQ